MSESPAYILHIKRKASYFSADNNSVIQNEIDLHITTVSFSIGVII